MARTRAFGTERKQKSMNWVVMLIKNRPEAVSPLQRRCFALVLRTDFILAEPTKPSFCSSAEAHSEACGGLLLHFVPLSH